MAQNDKFRVDAVCIRCLKAVSLYLPEKLGYKNRFQGWEGTVYRTNGWIYDPLADPMQPYTLCPECIKKDLDRIQRGME
jgi:hypothetical protein